MTWGLSQRSTNSPGVYGLSLQRLEEPLLVDMGCRRKHQTHPPCPSPAGFLKCGGVWSYSKAGPCREHQFSLCALCIPKPDWCKMRVIYTCTPWNYSESSQENSKSSQNPFQLTVLPWPAFVFCVKVFIHVCWIVLDCFFRSTLLLPTLLCALGGRLLQTTSLRSPLPLASSWVRLMEVAAAVDVGGERACGLDFPGSFPYRPWF